MKTIKKYSNRRLYDTDQSEYITLQELADLIADGDDVEVIDAKSGADLTQSVLAQVVVESKGAVRLLPVPVLTRMIRMDDDELAEFMSRYMSWAIDVYGQVKRGLREMNPYQLLTGGLPIDPAQALGSLFGQSAPWSKSDESVEAPSVEEVEKDDEENEESDMASIRREIQRLSERLDGMSE